MKNKTKAETSLGAKVKVKTRAKTKTISKTKVKKQIKKKTEKIPTLLGTAIIIIMAITAGMFVWVVKKDDFREIRMQNSNVNTNQVRKKEIIKKKAIETSPDVLSWQAYRNEQLGFEFQYPASWSFDSNLSKFIPNPQENCGPNVTGENGELMCLDNVVFEIVQNENNMVLTDLWKKEYGWENGRDYKNLEEYKIGDISAYKATTISAYDGMENEEFWVPLEDGTFLDLRGSYLNENEKNILDKMISTFKFIK